MNNWALVYFTARKDGTDSVSEDEADIEEHSKNFIYHINVLNCSRGIEFYERGIIYLQSEEYQIFLKNLFNIKLLRMFIVKYVTNDRIIETPMYLLKV